jgi:hypothetical protein
MIMGSRLITVRQGWAVVRIDSSDSNTSRAEELVHRITVKEVVLDEATADEEVARLNDLNRDKGAYYFVQVTRLRDRETSIVGQ